MLLSNNPYDQKASWIRNNEPKLINRKKRPGKIVLEVVWNLK